MNSLLAAPAVLAVLSLLAAAPAAGALVESQFPLTVKVSDAYGKQVERWNGVDVSVNARLAQGIFLQGGTSTGRTTEDRCEILEQVPEVSTTGLPYCHEQTAWLTQVKGSASYIIPRVNVSLAATYQYLPGPAISANWVVTNAQVVGLGRPLTGGNPTVNVIEPGTEYGPGLNQVDLRFGKILRFGATRTTINFDARGHQRATACM